MSFAGSAAEMYDRHLVGPLFDPFSKKLALGLPECRNLLEVGCATGSCTRRLASATHGGAMIVACDASEAMISLAARKIATAGSTGWVHARADCLPFPDGAFDVVVCGFGLMVLPDRLAAVAEINRVLLHGGVVRYVVWSSMVQNPWIGVVKDALARMIPDEEPVWYDDFFQFGDIEANLAMLDCVGFPEVRVTPVTLPLRASEPLALARGFVQGCEVLRSLIVRLSLDPAELEAAVARALVARFGDPIQASMRAFLFEAGMFD